MLTKQEEWVRDYMYDKFIPVLNCFFEEKNFALYMRWGRNCCRQTAVFGAALLSEMLPEYDWQVWDGDFRDIVKGMVCEYNHAWIYGEHKSENRALFVDLSRLFHERLFFDTNENKYPKTHPDYVNMYEIRRVRLDWRKMLKEETEYYTSMPSEKVLKAIKSRIGFSKKYLQIKQSIV